MSVDDDVIIKARQRTQEFLQKVEQNGECGDDLADAAFTIFWALEKSKAERGPLTAEERHAVLERAQKIIAKHDQEQMKLRDSARSAPTYDI